MFIKTVRLSSKGQLTLPREVLAALGADEGTDLILVEDRGRIVLVHADQVGRAILSGLEAGCSSAETAFSAVWDDPADAVWDELGAAPGSTSEADGSP